MTAFRVSGLEIAPAAPEDIPTLIEMIRELAEFEHLSDEVRINEGQLRNALSGPRPVIEAFIGRRAGEAVAYVAISSTFSTFSGRPRIWVEDLYVRHEARRQGIGPAMLAHAAAVGRDRGCVEMEWSVLDWNAYALRVYQRLGASPVEGWTQYRLSGEAFARLADRGQDHA